MKVNDKHEEYLIQNFPDTHNDTLCKHLGISLTTLHRHARRLGLRKSRAFMIQVQLNSRSAALASNLADGFARQTAGIRPRIERDLRRLRMGLPPLTQYVKEYTLSTQERNFRWRMKRYYGYITRRDCPTVIFYNDDTQRNPKLETRALHRGITIQQCLS